MPQSQPLIPALEDAETAKRVDEVIKQRDTADYNCFQLLSEHIEFLEEGVKRAVKSDMIDQDEADEIIESVREAVNRRTSLNNEFIDLLAGRR